MAVGQVRVFRSVRSRRLDGSKIARSAHSTGVWTLGRIGRAKLARRGILTREIGRPCLLESDPAVSLSVFEAGDVHRLRDDAERLQQPSQLLLRQRPLAPPFRPWPLRI